MITRKAGNNGQHYYKECKTKELILPAVFERDIEEDSSSDDDSREKLICDEINLIRMRRHLKQKRHRSIFKNHKYYGVMHLIPLFSQIQNVYLV